MSEMNFVDLSEAMKVKASLQRGECGAQGSSPPEIRRFSVSESSFKALVTSVRSVFSLSANTHCALFWKDEDGDLVQFSTTEELRHAVESQDDDTLRIYVTVTTGVTNENVTVDEEKEQEETQTRRVTFDTPLQASAPLYPQLPPDSHPHPHPQPHPHPHPHPQGPMNFGPWQVRMGGYPFMGPGMHFGRKGKKIMRKMMRKGMFNSDSNKEFNEVRQQVPETFRAWVRHYVRTWFSQGADAANQIATLPEGAPPHFRSWLHDFLLRWTQRNAGTASDGEGVEEGVEMGEEVMEGEVEVLPAPEGLPPMYYRWICLFLPRFYRRQAGGMNDGANGAAVPQCPAGFGRFHGHGMWGWKGHHGCPWKRGCHGRKWKKHGGQSSSSETEESDCGKKKMWKRIPKPFRKFVRVSVKQMHKKKGDNLKVKEKATRAGLAPEVTEFVEQILLEWHAKLSYKPPRDVVMEMLQGERTLPAGMEPDHFRWMCRFTARWHRKNAGKCDVMSAWGSSSSSSSESSSSEDEKEEEGYNPWEQGRNFWGRAMGPAHRHPPPHPHHPYPPFSMFPGMENGCPPPPPPPMCGFQPPFAPPPYYGPGFPMGPPGHVMGCGAKRGCWKGQGQGQGCKRWKNQDGGVSRQPEPTHEEMVDNVTEKMKKM